MEKSVQDRSQEGLANISDSKLQESVKDSANQFHVIGAYVAIIFDPLFGITDFFNIPNDWYKIFAIRLLVASVTCFGLYAFKKGKISVYSLALIPFFLISFQNAFTYIYVGNEQILGHNLNYVALFLGASIFLLWPIKYSYLTIGFSIAISFFFVQFNPNIDMAHFAVHGGLLLLTSSIFTVLMIEGRYRSRTKELKAKLALEESIEVTVAQKGEIERQNEELLSQAEDLDRVKREVEIANQQLSEVNNFLEEQVTARTKDLKKANREMDQLVYSLSHDFRTPMVNARGLIDLVQTISTEKEIVPFIEKVDDCLNRFDELLRDMMNYAVYWDQEAKKQQVDIKNVVVNVWGELEHQHNEKVDFEITGFEGHKVWNSYPEKLRVLLYCVLSNAVRYRRLKDGHKVSVSLTEEGNSDTYRIDIQDNGTGISDISLPRVFEMYFRGNSASVGAGLGLYIAKGVAQQTHCEIYMATEEGVGTTVSLTWKQEDVA